MTKYPQTIYLFIIICLLFDGVAEAQLLQDLKKLPDWFFSIPQQKGYIFSIGISGPHLTRDSSIAEANERGRILLSLSFKATVSGLFKHYLEEVETVDTALNQYALAIKLNTTLMSKSSLTIIDEVILPTNVAVSLLRANTDNIYDYNIRKCQANYFCEFTGYGRGRDTIVDNIKIILSNSRASSSESVREDIVFNSDNYRIGIVSVSETSFAQKEMPGSNIIAIANNTYPVNNVSDLWSSYVRAFIIGYYWVDHYYQDYHQIPNGEIVPSNLIQLMSNRLVFDGKYTFIQSILSRPLRKGDYPDYRGSVTSDGDYYKN